MKNLFTKMKNCLDTIGLILEDQQNTLKLQSINELMKFLKVLKKIILKFIC